MRWHVQVRSLAGDEAGYGTLFSERPHRIVQDGDRWLLESEDFIGVEEPEKVFELASNLLVLISGLARVRYSLSPLAATVAFQVLSDGSPGRCVVPLEPITFAFQAMPGRAVVGNVDVAAGENKKRLEFARSSDEVARVLEMLVEPSTWTSLYKIWEIVLRAADHQCSKVAKLGWADETLCTSFNRTANWYRTPGGRHAVPRGGRKPDQPMTLDSARRFVHNLVDAWLKAKLTNCA
jgi:hypothetical protein